MNKKNFSLKVLSVLLCLILALASIPMSVSANSLADGLYLKGNMNGWNCYDEYKFVDEGNGNYTLVLNMTGGNYEFKIATPNWTTAIGHPSNDNDNATLVIEADSIIKFTANVNTRNYTAESMNTKSDFTLGSSAQTIEAENYTFALGAVNVWDEASASGKKYVGKFDQGDSIHYGVTVNSKEAQTYRFSINVASEADNGSFNFVTGDSTTKVNFTSTGAWQTYKTVVVTKELKPGYNRISIENLGGTYNVDKIYVEPVKNVADAITDDVTSVSFAGYDSISNTSLIENNQIKGAKAGDFATIIVKPEVNAVYDVTVNTDASSYGKVAVGIAGEELETVTGAGFKESLVIDGETEIMVKALADGVTVNALTFKHTDNVQLMGYEFGAEGYQGIRFANEFKLSKISFTSDDSISGAKVVFSDGTDMVMNGNSLTIEGTKTARWFKIVAEGIDEDNLDITVEGSKVDASAKDISFEGYSSAEEGWEKVSEVPYSNVSASEGKVGFGFDKEVTVDKVVFITEDLTHPIKATLQVANGKTLEVTGTRQGSNVVFELDDVYSFGFYFDFGTEVMINAIEVYGDTTYKGGISTGESVGDYTMLVNGIIEDDSRAVANEGTHILTSETGSDREWTLTKDISDSPSFYAPNTPVAEAAYNLTMEEIYKSINKDATFGDVFYTGTNWAKVWTRDTAISMQYILSWLFPDISTNCAYAKVVGKDGNLTFEEDTGTGGSYPVSTDRIIMMLAVWETYLADGNKETLEYFYEVASNTIMQDYEVVYDEEAGLFRGETCGLDHRDKTYGDWTGEDDQNGIVTIAEGKAASTNILFCQAMKILAESAEILGKNKKEVDAWNTLAADLENAISNRLWHDELGTYASWEYPDWMGSPLSYKQDVLANGYAVWYNIGGQEKADSIMENHTLVNFGANTVYPQKNAQRWTDYKYHDSGVWPGWEAILMIGAVNNDNENNLLAEEIWNSCMRTAVSCLTNYEVVDYETGDGLHSTQQLWSVAATMAGYYRVLFGMEYTTEGITFDPYVPDWMEGPFYIENYKYRNATIDMELRGKGDTVKAIYVNDKLVANDYVLPTNASGEYEIVILLKDSGAKDVINLKNENTAKSPTAPNATLSGQKLSWNAVANCTYKVWTGTEYVDVDGTSYTIDTTKYGCYSVVAVDKTTGLWSELSAPKEYNPANTKVTVNANNYYDKAPTKMSSSNTDKKTVYFTNNKGWSTINIFFWGGSESIGWPGEAMTKVGTNEHGEDVYAYSIATDTPNIIFNNGSEQTVDITTGVLDDAGFYLDSKGEKWTVGTWTNTEFAPPEGSASAGNFTCKVNIPSDGVYQMSVIHSNQGDPTAGITAAIRSVYIDGEDVGNLVFPSMSFTRQVSSHLRLELTKGEHEIVIKYDTDNWYDRNMSQAHGHSDNNVTYHTVQFARTGDIVETPIEPPVTQPPTTEPEPVETYLLGDADGDDKVNVKDATAIQKHVAGLITLAEDGITAADVDANNNVNVKDATAIQKYVAGLDTGFDIGKETEK